VCIGICANGKMWVKEVRQSTKVGISLIGARCSKGMLSIDHMLIVNTRRSHVATLGSTAMGRQMLTMHQPTIPQNPSRLTALTVGLDICPSLPSS
jgi:hypothetical protein